MITTPTLFVNARFLTQEVTGVQRYAFGCCLQLKKIDAAIRFISPANIVQTEWASRLEAEITGTHTGWWWEQTDLLRFMRRQAPAMLWNPCNTGPAGYWPQMISLHDVAYLDQKTDTRPLFRLAYRFLIPRLLKRACHVFAVSETMKQRIASVYSLPPDKISVTLNGLDEEMLQADITRPKEKIILSVGSLTKRKNTALLIEAFLKSALAKDHLLYLIGSRAGIFQESDLPLHPSVHYLGQVDAATLIRYYQRASYVVCLSAYEGFGLPVLEALHFHCVVLCSDIPVFRELYQEAVQYCIPETEAVIQALRDLPSSDRPTAEMIRQLQSRFSYQKSAEQILTMLHKYTDANSPGA